MSTSSYYDLAQHHELSKLHANNVCSYLRGRLNARRVERLNDGSNSARYRIVRRAGAGIDDYTGTLLEICREDGLDIGRVLEGCK